MEHIVNHSNNSENIQDTETKVHQCSKMRSGGRSESSYSPNMPPSAAPRISGQHLNIAATEKRQPYNRQTSASTKVRHDLIRQRPTSGDYSSTLFGNSDYKSRNHGGGTSNSTFLGASNNGRPKYQFDANSLGSNNMQAKELGHGIQLSERQMQLRQYHSRKVSGMSPKIDLGVSKDNLHGDNDPNRSALGHIDANSPNRFKQDYRDNAKTIRTNMQRENKQTLSSVISSKAPFPPQPPLHSLSSSHSTSSHHSVHAASSTTTSKASPTSSPSSKKSKSLMKRVFSKASAKVRSSRNLGLSSPRSSASSSSSASSPMSTSSSPSQPKSQPPTELSDSAASSIQTKKRKQPIANERNRRQINDAGNINGNTHYKFKDESHHPIEFEKQQREEMEETTINKSKIVESKLKSTSIDNKRVKAGMTEKGEESLRDKNGATSIFDSKKNPPRHSSSLPSSRLAQSALNAPGSANVPFNSLTKRGMQINDTIGGYESEKMKHELHDNAINDEDAEFASFVDELKREVACDHTELWDSFQKALGHTSDTVSPLHPIETAADGKKKKKHLLNAAAEKTLASIHEHLLGQSRKSEITSSSQLVNDKKFARERIRRGDFSASSTSVEKSRNGGSFAAKAGRVEEHNRPSDRKERRHILSPRNRSKNKDEQKSETIVEPKDRNENTTRTINDTSVQSVSHSLNATQSVKVLQSTSQKPENEKKNVADQVPIAQRQTSWLMALKEKQRKLREEQKSCDDSTPENNEMKGSVGEEGVDAIVSIFGKRIPSTSKKRVPEIVRETPPNKEAEDSSPWPVKLKSVPKTSKDDVRESSATQNMAHNTVSDPYVTPGPWTKPNVARTAVPKSVDPKKPTISAHEKSSPKKSNELMGIRLKPTPTQSSKVNDSDKTQPVAELFRARTALHHVEPISAIGNAEHSTPSTSKTTDSSSNGSLVGRSIDLDNLPKDIFATQDEASIFWIGGNDGEENYPLAVGKHYILTARCQSPNSRKAEVTWCSRREDIKSLTLDVEATKADLALNNGSSKPLFFGSADDCLWFAQDFYRYKTSLSSRSRPPRPHQQQKQTQENVAEKLDCAANSDVDEKDENILKKYRLMLKMQTPPEAVQHKMTLEQVDQRLIDKLFSDNTPFDEKREDSVTMLDTLKAAPIPTCSDAVCKEEASAVSLTKEEEEVASKYRRMLKMAVPPEAVRHKMTQDKIDAKIVDAVLGGEGDDGSKPNEEASAVSLFKDSLTKEEEEVASKYRRMLKMAVPPEAVRHKMTQDKIDSKIIEVVLGSDASAPSEEIVAPLSGEEDNVASKYRRMLKMNVPKEAVRHKMAQDKIDDRIISAVLGQEEAGSALEGPKRRTTSATTKRRKTTGERSLVALHWTPLDKNVLERSVWGKTMKKRRRTVLEPKGGDISKLEELFQKKSSSRLTGGGKSQKVGTVAEEGKDEKQMAKLIDLTRANNVAISLKAFKDFTHKELAQTLGDLDPEGKVKGERVQFIGNLLPTPAEAQAVQFYKGDASRLVPAEIFFRHLESVQRIESKVRVMQTMETFHNDAKEASENFIALGRTCRQIIESEKLLQVLETVLNIGNIMNEGTRTGGAEGFKFDSLLKLTQTKSVDGKTTVLDYIVIIFDAKNELATLDLLSEFPDCLAASRMMLSDMINDLRSMRMNLNKCKTELIKMKNDQSEKRVTRSMTNKFQESANKSNDDPRSALLAAIQGRKSDSTEEKEEEPTDPRSALLSAIQNRGVGKEDSSSSSKNGTSVSFSPGVQKLEEFMKGANSTLSNLEKDRDNTIQACKDLSCYYGEEGEERAAASVLSVLAEFVVNLNASVKKNEQRKEAEQRKAMAEKKKKESDAMKIKKQEGTPNVEATRTKQSEGGDGDGKNTNSDARENKPKDDKERAQVLLNATLLKRSLF